MAWSSQGIGRGVGAVWRHGLHLFQGASSVFKPPRPPPARRKHSLKQAMDQGLPSRYCWATLLRHVAHYAGDPSLSLQFHQQSNSNSNQLHFRFHRLHFWNSILGNWDSPFCSVCSAAFPQQCTVPPRRGMHLLGSFVGTLLFSPLPIVWDAHAFLVFNSTLCVWLWMMN